jgi:Tol biopolymer transport system component
MRKRRKWLWFLLVPFVLGGVGGGAFWWLRRPAAERTPEVPTVAVPTTAEEALKLLGEANWRRHADDPRGASQCEAAVRAAPPEVLAATLAQARQSQDWWMQAAGVELEGQTAGFPLPAGWAARAAVWPPAGPLGEWPELIDVDTGQRLRFAPPLDHLAVASAAWSPEFGRLAYVAVTPRGATLWIADLLRSRLRCLPVSLQGPAPFDAGPIQRTRYAAWSPPAWSPDGTSLAVATTVGPDPWTLFLDPATGQAQRWLPAFTVSGWSADGRSLWLDNRLGYLDLSAGRLTFFENASAPPGPASGPAWWSPAGRYLLRQTPSAYGVPQVEWIDWQRQRRSLVAYLSTVSPTWSPDGTRFLVCGSTTFPMKPRLLVYDSAGQLLEDATGDPPLAVDDWFRWTRDGRIVRGHGSNVRVVWPADRARAVGQLAVTPTRWPPPWTVPPDRPQPGEVGAAVARLPRRVTEQPRGRSLEPGKGELIAFFSDRAGASTLWLARRDEAVEQPGVRAAERHGVRSLLNTGLPAQWITAATVGPPLALTRPALCITLSVQSDRITPLNFPPGTDRQGWLLDLARPAVHLLDSCWQAAWSPDGRDLLTTQLTFGQAWTSDLLRWRPTADGPPTAARVPVKGAVVAFLPLRWRADGWILGTDLLGRVPLALRVDGRAPLYRGSLPQDVDQLCDWSPDGSHVAYLDAAGTLRVAHLDAQGQARLVAKTPWGGCAHARFSPDGQSVAFTSTEPVGVPALYVLSLATQQGQRLTMDETWQMDYARYHAEPVWTADGGLLFITRELRGGQGQGDVWWLNPARTQMLNLTQAPANYWGLACSP